jgi:transcriptional regulator with XRE-family HTH domain
MDVIHTCAVTAGPIPQAPSWPTKLGDERVATGNAVSVGPPLPSLPTPKRRLHQLRDVRRREGISLQKVARRLGISVREVQEQERPTSDILVSELYRWQEALDVPAAELLHEPEGVLSPPLQWRAQLVRVMKTVRSIQENARQTPIRRLAEVLVNQLVEVMPELKDTVAWPTFGRQRKRQELGQAYFRGLSLGPMDEPEPENL